MSDTPTPTGIARKSLDAAGETRRMSMWVTDELKDQVAKEARRSGISVSEFFRQCARLYLSLDSSDRSKLRGDLRQGVLGQAESAHMLSVTPRQG